MESTRKLNADFSELESSVVSILDLIFRECPDGFVFKDRDFYYRAVNNAFCKSYNIEDRERFIGQKENAYIPKEMMKLIQDADREVMDSRCSINYVINVKNDILLNVTTFPIIYKEVFIGLISIVKDITQEEAIKEAFVNKHYEYINSERKLQSQRETFVATIGHDLKNPTIAQIRSLELLLNGAFGDLAPNQKELLQMILDSCRYMNGMLSSLLTTYRNYGGIIKLNFEEFDFSDLINECVSEMTYVAKDKGVEININNENFNYIIEADRVQLKRVIMNLLSNGIKYAYANTSLNLKIYIHKKQVCFEFENESPYIPEEKQKAIFAQYVSYASNYNELGIGLGLYASQKIIEGHGGNIFVKSSKNNRNSFGFKIPIIPPKSSEETFIYF